MAKICIINDTHFGVRSDNKNFYNYFRKFYENVFFPYLDEHDIKHVIHLGDLVDRRKYIQYLTSNLLHDIFMQPLFDRGIELHIMCGNHDTQYRHTNEYNAIRALYGHSKYDFHLYENPETVEVAGFKILMMPWICNDTYDRSIAEIEKTDAQVLMGHLELAGFEMDKGHIADHGMTKDIFNKFDMVLSGHYHHKSDVGNIHYLGSPCQFTWADYDDQKGFHIFDTETRELEFVKNPYEVFKKFHYDDSVDDAERMFRFDDKVFEGTYIKVIIKNRTDNSMFDRLMVRLENAGAADIQIVEDHLNLDSISDEELIDEAQDTMTILAKYVLAIDTSLDMKKVISFIRTLYEEALTVDG